MTASPAISAPRRIGSTPAGTLALISLIVRRDRLRIAIWTIALPLLVFAQAGAVKGLYPSHADLVEAARLIKGNPSFISMLGPAYGAETIGGRTAFEISMFMMVVVALMNLFLVTRHLRGDEESGRAELLRSTVVGRGAPIVAVLVVAAACDIVLLVLMTLALVAAGLPFAGSLALASGVCALGFFFAAVASFTSQLTIGTRAASAIAGVSLAVIYVIRAMGDVRGGALSWVSPLGWVQSMRPFADERWWPLVLFPVASVGVMAAASAVSRRRDLGFGVFPPRPGPVRADSRLTTPFGFSLRLHRGALIGWGVGLFLGGVAYGSFGKDVQGLIEDNKSISKFLAQAGGNIADSFLASTLMVLALIGTGFALQAVMRMNVEETSGRAESLLTASVSRTRWAVSHLLPMVAGTVAVLALTGLGSGLMFSISVDDFSYLPRLLGAALAYVPAVLLVASIALAAYGIAGRAVLVAWPLLGFFFVVTFFGQALSLPVWLRELSPYYHVPLMPAEAFDPLATVVLLAVTAVIGAIGILGLRARDMTSA